MKRPWYTDWVIDSNGIACNPTATVTSNKARMPVATIAIAAATCLPASAATKSNDVPLRRLIGSPMALHRHSQPVATPHKVSDTALMERIKSVTEQMAEKSRPMPYDLSKAIDDHFFDLL